MRASIMSALGWLALFAAPATAAPPVARAPASSECVPGRGPSVDTAETFAGKIESRAIELPRNATLVGPLDRTVLCADVPDDVPCLVEGPLVLSCARVNAPIDLRRVIVRGDLRLDGADLASSLRLGEVLVLGALDLSDASVEGDVSLDAVTVSGAVSLERARISGRVMVSGLGALGGFSLEGAELTREAELRNVLVGGDALISPATTPSLNVSGMTVTGACSMLASSVTGDLTLDRIGARTTVDVLDLSVGGESKISGLSVGEGLTMSGTMRRGLSFVDLRVRGDAELLDVEIGGALGFDSARIRGQLFLSSVKIGRGVRVSGSQLDRGADFSDSRIEGGLVLSGSRFGGPVDVSAAKLSMPPRVIACTPSDPLLRSQDELETIPEDEGTQPE